MNVAEVREGERVAGVFRVARKGLPLTKSGKRYLALTLADRTGQIEARAFEEHERFEPGAVSGGFVRIEAEAQRYKGRLELKLLSLEAVAEGDVDQRDFAPRSRFEPQAMLAELRGLVAQTRNPFVRELLLGLLDDPTIREPLLTAPAAKSIHHAFSSGLLEHTLSVLQMGWRVCDHYPQLDRDLVTAGCVLHDLGKVRELSAEPPFEYTDEGRLVGHLVIACQWIRERAARIPGFPPALEQHLTHLVTAHHGKLEHGSPKLAMTLEAVVVHAVDELDSRIESFGSIFARDQREGPWTDWSRLYDRPLFKGPSWNGKPLPPDARRLERGLYDDTRPREAASETPVVVEHPDPPVALPGPAREAASGPEQPQTPEQPPTPTPEQPQRAQPTSQPQQQSLPPWERPPPRVREYNIQYPDARSYAPRPLDLSDLFGKKKPGQQ